MSKIWRIASAALIALLALLPLYAQSAPDVRTHTTPIQKNLEKTNKRTNISNSQHALLKKSIAYDESLVAAGDNPLQLNNLAVRLTQEGRHDKAAEVMEKVVELRPKNVSFLVNLAIVYLNSNVQLRALELLLRASEIDPENDRVQWLLCDLFSKVGRHREAVECFESRMKTETLDAVSVSNLSVSLIEVGELDDALLHLEQANARYPSNAPLLNNYALALFRDKKYPQSSRVLKRLVKLKPKVAQYRFNFAVVLLASKNRRGALQQYAVLKKSDPDLASQLYGILFRDRVVNARQQSK